MFRCILVPLDGSPHSEQSLGIAEWLGDRSGARLRLCHVREAVEPGFSAAVVEDEAAILSHFEVYLGVLARRVAQRTGRDASHRVAVGAAVAGLIGLAREERADLIVLTTHGHGGLAHAWLGGTAEGLAQQAGIPLLLVRPSAQEPRAPAFGRILVPLDGSATAEVALDTALALALMADADLHLVAVVELPVRLPASPGAEPQRLSGAADPDSRRATARGYLEDVAARLRSEGLRVDVDVRDAISPATAILQAAAEAGVSAIAMATHGRSRLRRRTVGSVSDKVIRAAGVPVLLVPAREIEPKSAGQRTAAASTDA